MTNSPIISRTSTDGHTVFFYDSQEERLQILAEYFNEGLGHNELCIFVTPDSTAVVLQKFTTIGYDFIDAVANDSLRIFEMNQTYLTDGHFAADYMLKNIQKYQADSKQLGYSGLRTAGEMSWLFDNPHEIPEAYAYEHAVNTVSEHDEHFVGLCMYPVQRSFGTMMHDVLHAHPSFIYDGQTHISPHYGAIAAPTNY